MEQEQKKSPVEIVQKLIAIHTTRKEASEKMVKNNASQDLQDRLKLAAGQSEQFVKALLNELSEFGDAVQSEVDREDEYNEIWNKATGDIDTMDASVLSGTFTKLEGSLIKVYTQVIDLYNDLPVTLNDLIISQLKGLEQK